MDSGPDNRAVSELFADALNQFSNLIRSEIQLARAEISSKTAQALVGLGLLAGAAVLLIPSLVLVLMALSAFLVELGMRPSVSHLLAGILAALIASVLGWAGMSRLRAENLIPSRTIKQLQRDAAAAREQM
jgi:uncharacterized membrane protein YqjE